MKDLTAAQRLIVAADYPAPYRVLDLAQALKGTGVVIKVNSILRHSGYELIAMIKAYDLEVFADLKLKDIPATLSIDGEFLARYKPAILTVMADAGPKAMAALKAQLPETEVLAVTVLTTMDEAECRTVYGCSIDEGVIRFANLASRAGMDGLILAPKEVAILKRSNMLPEGLSLNCPGIRPEWAVVKNDDQNAARVMTPREAILAGVDRIVVGRPITQSDDPRGAVLRTIDEIERAMLEFSKPI